MRDQKRVQESQESPLKGGWLLMIESCRLDCMGRDRDTTENPSSMCLIRTCSLVGASASTLVRETRSFSCVSIAQNNSRSYMLGDCFVM